MAMFAHSGTPVDPAPFASRICFAELIYYDGPRFSVISLGDERMALEFWMDAEGHPLPGYPHAQVWRTLIVPTTDDIVDELKAGRIDIRAAMLQPAGWLLDEGGGTCRVWAVDIPAEPGIVELIPDTGVMLPEHAR